MKKKTVSQVIREVVAGKKYFSVAAIKKAAQTARHDLNPGTVNQYLYDMKRAGEVYNAGRGWYSSIPHMFLPSRESVEHMASAIKDKYPLLSFSVWSTEQLQPFAHHVMTRFIRFVYVDFDAMPSIVDSLKDLGYHAHLNPQKREAEKHLDSSSNAVVVRASITREPLEGFYATAEKILVDLFMERDRLSLMDTAEYQRVFRNLVLAYRINIARLLEYAERRKVRTAILRDVLKSEHDVFLFDERP